ncbi:MAG: hypothetical protein E6J03_08300 [Chloroflexi bacterium]|nr:MAG: hypothetical protein E6J03_08300 [Chloroflexota bacterium]
MAASASGKVKTLRIERSSPSSPSRATATAARCRGWKAVMYASINRTPASPQAACIARASSPLQASGFSQSTCRPAAAARSVQRRWRPFGRGMYTASTSGSSSTPS